LKNIYKSLAKDGVVVISQWLLNDEKTGPASAALMGLNMIIETHGGKKPFICRDYRQAQSSGVQKIRETISSGTSRILSLVTNHKQKRHKEKNRRFL
jgi:hypothetical protein